MSSKYELSSVPELGELKPAESYNKAHTFSNIEGMIQIHSYAHVDESQHLKKVALIAAAPDLLKALIAIVEEEDQLMEEWNDLNNSMGCEPVIETQRIKNAKIAIKSALGIKQ